MIFSDNFQPAEEGDYVCCLGSEPQSYQQEVALRFCTSSPEQNILKTFFILFFVPAYQHQRLTFRFRFRKIWSWKKKSRFRFRKILVSEKSFGFGKFGLGRKVSILVSEKCGLGKKSRFQFRKI